MFNLKEIMLRAWRVFRDNAGEITFGEALHRSWVSAKAEPINAGRIAEAKAAAGIEEETRTWKGWGNLQGAVFRNQPDRGNHGGGRITGRTRGAGATPPPLRL